MEAEYAIDDRSALCLYDCLIPRIREHRKLKLRPENTKEELREDFKAQQEVLILQLKVLGHPSPKLIKENGEMKDIIEQLENESIVIKWLTNIV